MIQMKRKGNFDNITKHLKDISTENLVSDFDVYGQMGVDALSTATPVETGVTASDWDYEIIDSNGHHGVRWFNTNSAGGTPVVILLQYGHGTGTGGYVEGRDFINPAMRPVFEHIANEIRKKVATR